VLSQGVLALSAAVLLVACDAASTEPTDGDARAVATVGQLLGPWSRTPFVAAPELLAAADRTCRSDIPMPNGVKLVVVDVRGGGLAQVYLAGPNGAAGSCNDMKIDRNGRFEAGGGGSTSDGGQAEAPLGQIEIRLRDISGSGRPLVTSAVAGPVGPGIARVEIGGPGQPTVEATLSNRWFAAWTPGAWPAGWSVRGFDPNGALVTTVQGP
jgi:hypothetical protein